jgi:hypothetical protein
MIDLPAQHRRQGGPATRQATGRGRRTGDPPKNCSPISMSGPPCCAPKTIEKNERAIEASGLHLLGQADEWSGDQRANQPAVEGWMVFDEADLTFGPSDKSPGGQEQRAYSTGTAPRRSAVASDTSAIWLPLGTWVMGSAATSLRSRGVVAPPGTNRLTKHPD